MAPGNLSLAANSPGTTVCVWCVNPAPNYWHNGSLPGTSTIMVRTVSGLCWAAFANAHRQGINQALDQMKGAVVKAVLACLISAPAPPCVSWSEPPALLLRRR